MDYPKDNLGGATSTKVNRKLGVTPVLILCDNSGSMMKYVDTVNKCLKKLIEDLQSDANLKNKIELSIMSFNIECKEILPFTRVSNINPECIKEVTQEEWATYLGMALTKAVSVLAAEKDQFKKAKVEYCQPNLIVISDGVPQYEEKAVTNVSLFCHCGRLYWLLYQRFCSCSL